MILSLTECSKKGVELAVVTMECVEVAALLVLTEDNGDIILFLYGNDADLDRVLEEELAIVTMEGVGVPALCCHHERCRSTSSTLTEDIGDIVLVLYDTEH
jgi:hypothetical protein